MASIRTVLFTSIFVLASHVVALAESAAPKNGASAKRPMTTYQMPALPDPVKVAVAPKTTAVLLFDMIDPTCVTQPRCTKEMLPAISALLARARKADMLIGYGSRAPLSKWLPEVAPASGDLLIANSAQDRFYNTDLDKQLKGRGITHLILTGWKVSGSVLYTSVGATLRGYTVVIPVDASLAPEHEIPIGLYQILNQSARNAGNEPLKPRASTLSRTDLISF